MPTGPSASDSAVAPSPDPARTEKAKALLDEYRRLAARDPLAALLRLDEALRIDPRSGDAWNERGQLHGKRGDYDAALADFERAVLYSPSDMGAANNIARIHYLRGAKDKAFEAIDRSLAKHSQNPEGYLLRGILFIEAGRAAEGDADIDYGDWLRSGLRAQWAAQIEKARKGSRQWELQFPELNGGTLQDAAVLEGNEEDRKAAWLAERTVAKEPANIDAHILLATAHYNLKQFRRASEDVELALRLNPESAEGHRLMGLCDEAFGRGDEAIAEFGKAIRIDPSFAMAYVNRAAAVFEYHPNLQGRALADLDAALRADPGNPYAWFNRAPYYQPDFNDPEPDWDFMIRHYSKAIELKPDFAAAYGSRGVAYLGKYQLTNAAPLRGQGERDIAKALELKPELKATLDAMVDDLVNIPASKADLKSMIDRLFNPVFLAKPSAASSDGSGPRCGSVGGAATACRAGDGMAYERYKAGTATSSDRRKYGDY